MDCSHRHIVRLGMGTHEVILSGFPEILMCALLGVGVGRECMKVVICSVAKGTGGGQRQSQCVWEIAYLKQIN